MNLRAIVQRVSSSKVVVDNTVVGKIGKGLNVLLGISVEDNFEDVKYMKDKIVNLRIFEDQEGKLNKSLKDINGELIVISQFTLYGDCRKGRRPSFINALSGDKSEVLYNEFIHLCEDEVDKVEKGIFGADMQVEIQNDGPVTLLIESKKTF